MAVHDKKLCQEMIKYRQALAEKVEEKDSALREQVGKSWRAGKDGLK